MFTRRGLLAAAAAAPLAGLGAGARAEGVKPHALADFFAPAFTLDAALSPDGRKLALLFDAVVGGKRRKVVALKDAEQPDGPVKPLNTGDLGDIDWIEWARDDRLLVRVDHGTDYAESERSGLIYWTAGRRRRLYSLGLDGSAPVPMFQNPRVREFNLDLAEVVDLLPDEPHQILMPAMDMKWRLPSLFKVDLLTGAETLFEAGKIGTVGWQVAGGAPILRVDANRRGTWQWIYARAPGESEWRLLRKSNPRDLPEFAYLGPTARTGVVLVAARQEGEDVVSARELDLASLSFGPPLSQRPGRDVLHALFDERDRYIGAAFAADRIDYDFADKSFAAHFKAINDFLGGECNVTLFDVDRDQRRFLAHVSGPREPGAYFLYDRKAKSVHNVGAARPNLALERLGRGEVLRVPTRDGGLVDAYLTAPPGGAPGPLVVLPHGGPELRDYFDWDRQVQVFAAQGWWVLQPNFRGSGGYGRAFAEAGWKRWGERMQADVEDCVAYALKERGLDAKRVAIMGSSYGGYAALMGAVRRPDLYKAVISICGVSDLPEMLAYEKREDDSPDRDVYSYWVKRIGDPKADKAALEAASPARRAAALTMPVMLVHGKQDPVVPVEQTRIMAKALEALGRKAEVIEVDNAGHADWDDRHEQILMAGYVQTISKAFAAAT
ncbi:S9 family peptidase [Caulobacter sp. 17J80-11]|uniref:alpha/beta hydrolase family protein n=1 Tax=Caulobacter sp. 17J80-11 TaxID=2763502 RepID=UPI001653D594|nr:alpha/beta fold hydrolase [Caulobacter sp. 17J80-11]MBC6981417.1 S9 family peptidase [Caulobacter sp. 17J80-11]